jgi:hypothetical protein
MKTKQYLWLFLAFFMLTSLAEARMHNNLAYTCKHEAARYYGIRKSAIRTFPVERRGERLLIFGELKNTNRNLNFKCIYNRHGQYMNIKEVRNKHYSNRHTRGNNYIPKIVKRVCKGEASVRWHMRPNQIRIKNAKHLGGRDYRLALEGRNYRGKCEVSQSGHIYEFRSKFVGRDTNHYTPKVALQNCKRRASSRWGINPRNIRIDYSKRVGRDQHIIKLSSRYDRAECEVSKSGWIYSFYEY